MIKRLALTLLLGTFALVGASDVFAAASVSVQVKAKVSAPGAMFLVAKPPRPVVSPVRVTLGLWRGGVFRSRIVGMRPGRLVFAGVRARPVPLYVVAAPAVHVGAPAAVVHVEAPAPVVVVEPPSPVIRVEVGGPRVHVHGHGRGHGHGRHGGKVRVGF